MRITCKKKKYAIVSKDRDKIFLFIKMKKKIAFLLLSQFIFIRNVLFQNNILIALKFVNS